MSAISTVAAPKLHPRNTGFEWRSVSRSLTRLTAAQRDQYNEHGYVLVKDVFRAEEIAAVQAAIDPFEAAFETRLREEFGGKTFIAKADAITFTTHLVLQSEIARQFSAHPVFREICQDLLTSMPRLYWDQAVYKKPGNPEEFPWHQDNGYTFTEPQQYLTCWVPLSQATEANGCPWVVPGLHRQGTLNHELKPLGLTCLEEPKGAVCVPGEVGDVIVFSSLTPHRTGPNLTPDVRKAYILQYAPDGAVVHGHDGITRTADDPQRQYLLSDVALD